MAYRTITIHPDRPARARLAPRLLGDASKLSRVVSALQVALDRQVGLCEPPEAWLRELRLAGDEAVLALAPGLSHCGGEVAQTAFETLRSMLPDTDIYVRTAAQ